MKKIIAFLLVCMTLTMVGGRLIIAEGTMYKEGSISINENALVSKSVAYFDDTQAYIPLRTIFEAIGAEVKWQDDNIIINYEKESYIAKFVALNSNFPDKKYFLIKNIKNIDSNNNKSYIQLNTMSSEGYYKIINDRTYLYQKTAIRLMNYFGYNLDVDSKNKKVNIYKSAQ